MCKTLHQIADEKPFCNGDIIEIPAIYLEDHDYGALKDLITVSIEEKESVAALDEAMINSQILFIMTQKDDMAGSYDGVVTRITRMSKKPGLPHQVVLKTLCTARIESVLFENPFLKCKVEPITCE